MTNWAIILTRFNYLTTRRAQLGAILLGLTAAGFFSGHYLFEQLNSYLLSTVEQTWGSQKVAPEHEAKIRALAHEMGINAAIDVRKLNCNALQRVGYHNAAAVLPTVLGYWPSAHPAYLYISEGFFEDLPLEEQRFVLGHELIHIREQHTRYALLFYLLAVFAILLFVYCMRKYIMAKIRRHMPASAVKWTAIATFWLMVNGLSLVPFLLLFAYYRRIEKDADLISVEILQSSDGGLKLLHRWEREFSIARHNPYGGWIADHPSVHERREYLSEIKKRNEIEKL